LSANSFAIQFNKLRSEEAPCKSALDGIRHHSIPIDDHENEIVNVHRAGCVEIGGAALGAVAA
jgi:hypothetical protein